MLISEILKTYMSQRMTNKMACGQAETQISLGIRPVWSVFAVRLKKAWVLSYPLSTQRKLWSAWADLSFRWAHIPFCRFCHVLAHMRVIDESLIDRNWLVWPRKHHANYFQINFVSVFIALKCHFFSLSLSTLCNLECIVNFIKGFEISN